MSHIFDFKPAAAFSPGHLTGFFKICSHTDPHQKGSVGAGIVLDKGIRSFVTPFLGGGESVLKLNDQISSCTTVLSAASMISDIAEKKYGTPFHFEILETSDLPVGSGFGMSAAGTLSTVFAISHSLKLGLPVSELVEIAHISEVTNGSGLGDVAGESLGSLVVRKKPGGPKFGAYYSLNVPSKKVFCLVLGELSTKKVISDPVHMSAINKAGESALQNFLKKQTSESFMEESRRFTKDVGLLSDAAKEVLDSIPPKFGCGAQAMIGNTVFSMANHFDSPEDEAEAEDILFSLLGSYGTVYECRIGSAGPHIC